MTASPRRSSLALAQSSVAASLDLPPRLMPHVGELFADLDSFGSSPRRIVAWLCAARIGSRHTVLDLGCGKGAAAIRLARRPGCRVIGVDACEPFVQAARIAAESAAVGERCQFICTDLHWAARSLPRADAAIMLGVLPIEEAAPLLAPMVRPGGLIILDDAIVLEGHKTSGDRPTRAEAREFLASLGGTIEREFVVTPRAYQRMEATLYKSISRRAGALRKRQPRLATAINQFLKRQRLSGASLSRGPLRGAMWMMRTAVRK